MRVIAYSPDGIGWYPGEASGCWTGDDMWCPPYPRVVVSPPAGIWEFVVQARPGSDGPVSYELVRETGKIAPLHEMNHVVGTPGQTVPFSVPFAQWGSLQGMITPEIFGLNHSKNWRERMAPGEQKTMTFTLPDQTYLIQVQAATADLIPSIQINLDGERVPAPNPSGFEGSADVLVDGATTMEITVALPEGDPGERDVTFGVQLDSDRQRQGVSDVTFDIVTKDNYPGKLPDGASSVIIVTGNVTLPAVREPGFGSGMSVHIGPMQFGDEPAGQQHIRPLVNRIFPEVISNWGFFATAQVRAIQTPAPLVIESGSTEAGFGYEVHENSPSGPMVAHGETVAGPKPLVFAADAEGQRPFFLYGWDAPSYVVVQTKDAAGLTPRHQSVTPRWVDGQWVAVFEQIKTDIPGPSPSVSGSPTPGSTSSAGGQAGGTGGSGLLGLTGATWGWLLAVAVIFVASGLGMVVIRRTRQMGVK